MKKLRCDSRGVWLLFAALWLPFNTSAQIVAIEGHASMNLLLVSDQTVICSKSVSGQKTDGLFGLDLATKTVKWRQQAEKIAPQAVSDESGAFYMFANNFLQKRSLDTGVMVWETRLDSIPEQKTAPKLKLTDYWHLLLIKLKLESPPLAVTLRWPVGPPNFYAYKPVVSASGITVFRVAMDGRGCIVSPCFDDWCIFNRKTGIKMTGGSGKLLGYAGSTVAFQDKDNLFWMDNRQITELSLLGLTNSPFVFDSFYSPWTIGQQHCFNNRCLFSTRDNINEEVFVFDGRTHKTSCIRLPLASNFQVDWVLLDHFLLRYAQCPAYSAEGKRIKDDLWFETYDLAGRRVAKTYYKGSDSILSFLGTTASGKVLFENGERTIAVEVPSLRITSVGRPRAGIRSGNREGTYSSRHMILGSNQVYEIDGNITITKMRQDPLEHDLRLKALDIETGRVMWEHVEHVKVKKLAAR